MTTDGPYKEINIWSEPVKTPHERYTLKLTTEPTATIRIGSVEFNTIDDTLVLANHGLQVGQKIKLDGSSGTGWGNVRQNISGATSTDGTKQTKMDGGLNVAIASTSCTFNSGSATGDVIGATAHGLTTGMKLQFTGTLPASLTAATDYYVLPALVSGSYDDYFKVSATNGGSPIPYGSGGSGNAFIGIVGDDTFDLDVFVVATTSTTIQFSDTDSGSIREFELVQADPPTTAANAKVTLQKYVYKPSTSSFRSLTLYNNKVTGTSLTNAYFDSTNDIGRLIRINPLLKGGNNIGGIKWAWGIIKTISSSVITVEFKSEMATTRDTYGTAEFRLGAFS